MKHALYITAALGMLVGGCRGQISEDPPITPIRNMHVQQRYNSQAQSPFFADQRTMRPVPAGTVARFPGGATPVYRDGTVGRDEHFDRDDITLGHLPDRPDYVTEIPAEVVSEATFLKSDRTRVTGMSALLHRGQERYEIYCTPCHGSVGDGRGVVWARGQGGNYQYPQPASLHDARIRRIPDGQLYATIANGVRNMPGYAAQLPVRDRWAVVAYVRALQLAQVNNGGTP